MSGVFMGQSVEIICIGNELLIGKTLNTNAQWLTRRVTTLGLTTRRITVVGDDIDEISSAIKEAIQRRPRFILITGGLGPTFDDKTLEGLAEALGRSMEINEEALKMIKEKYLSYAREGRMEAAELTPHRVKMAKLPEGATPLRNPVGTAPAVSIEHENVTIISLPGVPSEMKSIFDESVASVLKKAAGNVIFFETGIETTKVMESEMAPLIEKVMHSNPRVYIKSHPKGAERVPRIEFHLSTTAKDSGTARKEVSKALVQLRKLIQEKGGKIKPIKSES
ncbi:MAG TPA: nicotinamide mononucleotide deamidase-related protein [Candidatus Bathyarchaeota archaeon]|nr:nicotinamide mononucleotide deamidase-related protein [Candidatus Bathyarchaeota archaeon]